MTDGNKDRLYRKQSADDSNANDVQLVASPPAFGDKMSFGIDRGDLYAFSERSDGQLAYRPFFSELGWDAPETVIGTSPSYN